MTILSVNKTREVRWAQYALIFCLRYRWTLCSDDFKEETMNRKTRYFTHGALIAALYTALTYLQNFLLPESTSMAIQFRASEALCVLAFFTPAAIPGLALGCFLYNISYFGALPLDFLVGTLATLLAVWGMRRCRNVTIKGFPLLGLLLPAITNAFLVGAELTVYIGGMFWLNALYVAIGEAAVLLTLGSVLYYAIKGRRLETQLFGEQ